MTPDPVPSSSVPSPSVADLLSGHPGRVSVVVRDLETAEVLYEHDARHVHPAASTIKVALLVSALLLVQQGEADLEERHVMSALDPVPGDGVLRELDPGLPLSLRDLLTLMIVVSDNTATNMVIDRVGVARINRDLRSFGLHDTELLGRLQLPAHLQTERQRAGERNRTSAADMASLLLALARGELLAAPGTALALDILSRQQHRDLLTRHLPRDDEGELLYRTARKHGELTGVHHEVGVVWSPRPLVVSLMSSGGLDGREHPDNHEVVLLARLAAVLVETFGGSPESAPENQENHLPKEPRDFPHR